MPISTTHALIQTENTSISYETSVSGKHVQSILGKTDSSAPSCSQSRQLTNEKGNSSTCYFEANCQKTIDKIQMKETLVNLPKHSIVPYHISFCSPLDYQHNNIVSIDLSSKSKNPCSYLHHLKNAIRSSGAMLLQEQNKHSQSIKSIEKYLVSIQDIPTHACNICETLHFEKEMCSMNKSIFKTYYGLLTTSVTNEIKIDEQICRTCYSTFLNAKFPKFATLIYIRRNQKLMFIEK